MGADTSYNFASDDMTSKDFSTLVTRDREGSLVMKRQTEDWALMELFYAVWSDSKDALVLQGFPDLQSAVSAAAYDVFVLVMQGEQSICYIGIMPC